MTMDRHEIHEIAQAAAKEAVKETLEALGVDTENPAEERADRVFLRSQRIMTGRVSVGMRMVIYGTLVSAAIALLWQGIKHAIRFGGS